MQETRRYKEDLPQFPSSLWRDTVDIPHFPKLMEDHRTEVAVVGGGITGITAAYLLAKEGYQVTLLEAGELFAGTTGFTTAKITAQHGLIYNELVAHFGEEQARLYYRSQREAMDFMLNTAKALDIDCGLTREDAYLYADAGDKATLKQLQDEFTAYRQLGIPGEWVDSLPIPLQVEGAIRLPDQARFHPLQYLKALLEAFLAQGGKVFEHTMIGEKVDQDSGLTLHTEQDDYLIHCHHAVSASHFPFYDGGALYFTRLHAERSYALAIEAETEFVGGMYLSAGNTVRSLRAVEWEGKRLVIVGGENHKTGQGECTYGHYENLERFGGELLGIKQIPYRWSTQDLITLDNVPYIGKISDDKKVYITTGFRKWGMTNGTLAALMIRDEIVGKRSRYAELYDPTRFKAHPGIRNFVAQNANVAKELVTGKLEIVFKKTHELAPDEGAVVFLDGRKVGAYRDDAGSLHLVDRTCTHLGCECEWNAAERSWDCPCHGSRFSIDGDVLEGPATQPLEKLGTGE
ncbi:FAD-dependent oxidoreductase [Paenibacillus sp. NFR01]|uniref:FAD-dependent oxidoreductase n=1 Tax=Paenibacillus sp. NFR01 TaxID=1566279 RepID=UPI0008B03C80|nr:FAD-dependent oxidoreductase [Paenibacillus sp. NFR01]SEU12651.1 Glycine/D-amino acid oxidase [Paenibacillus sp. NFR01]